jgi:hypothetical protein
MALLPLLAGGLIAKKINKGKELKQQDKVTGNYQNDFPISNDCAELDNTIRLAQFELVKVTNEPQNSKGAKRNRDRALGILTKWVDTLKNYRKDLTCGMGTNQPLSQSSGNVVAQPQPMPIASISSLTTNVSSGVNDPYSNPKDQGNDTSDSTEKKPNYLLYGGIGLASVVVLYFVFKKN